jgi:hypothetical protein
MQVTMKLNLEQAKLVEEALRTELLFARIAATAEGATPQEHNDGRRKVLNLIDLFKALELQVPHPMTVHEYKASKS